MTLTDVQPPTWTQRCVTGLEAFCLEVGHRVSSVGFIVLIVAFGAWAVGKPAWLLFPIAFGCADIALAAGIGAWVIAARRGQRRREAVGIVVFSILVLIPSAVMLICVRNGTA